MSLTDTVPSFFFRTKGGSRLPRADGRQNRLGLWRRVFLRRYVGLLTALSWWYLHSVCGTEQFEDEIHPRLRFAHRGLVGMANNGSKNSNDSQFFITLGACSRLPRASLLAELSSLSRPGGRITRKAHAVWAVCRRYDIQCVFHWCICPDTAVDTRVNLDAMKIGAMGM